MEINGTVVACFIIMIMICGVLEEAWKRHRRVRKEEIAAMGDGPDFEAMDAAGEPLKVDEALPGEIPESEDLPLVGESKEEFRPTPCTGESCKICRDAGFAFRKN